MGIRVSDRAGGAGVKPSRGLADPYGVEEPLPLFLTPEAVRARYVVHTLGDVRLAGGGVRHGDGLLRWSQVLRVHAAEVGEPQGVRAVVFDLVVGREGVSWRVLRFDAEPGKEAVMVARQLAGPLAPSRLAASIKSLTDGGSPGAWYPDLESYDEWSLVAVSAALAGTVRCEGPA